MNDLTAKALVDSLPGMTPKLSLLTRAVARLETNYGTKFRGNWGAITGKYKGASFEHKDSKWDAKQGKQVWYTTNFRLYPSDLEAAKDLASLLSRKYASAVAAVPDWPAVSRSLYGYYLGVGPKEQAVATHAGALAKHVAAIQKTTGESLPVEPFSFPVGGEPEAETITGILLGGAGLLAVLHYLRRKKQ